MNRAVCSNRILGGWSPIRELLVYAPAASVSRTEQLMLLDGSLSWMPATFCRRRGSCCKTGVSHKFITEPIAPFSILTVVRLEVYLLALGYDAPKFSHPRFQKFIREPSKARLQWMEWCTPVVESISVKKEVSAISCPWGQDNNVLSNATDKVLVAAFCHFSVPKHKADPGFGSRLRGDTSQCICRGSSY
jgi:hypothetical protein